MALDGSMHICTHKPPVSRLSVRQFFATAIQAVEDLDFKLEDYNSGDIWKG
jgi:hypothetical protein